MDYELRNVEFVGTPHENIDGLTLDIYINVSSGVVGDTYGFVKVNTTQFNCAKTLTANQILALGQTTGQAYVTANYPNT